MVFIENIDSFATDLPFKVQDMGRVGNAKHFLAKLSPERIRFSLLIAFRRFPALDKSFAFFFCVTGSILSRP